MASMLRTCPNFKILKIGKKVLEHSQLLLTCFFGGGGM